MSLFYDELFIGEANFKNSYLIPDESNMAYFDLRGIKIWNMHGFKGFIQRIIPRPSDGSQLESRTPTAALEIDKNGHKLSMSIRLDEIGPVKALESTVWRTNDRIKIIFVIQNPTRVGINFGESHFRLQKDGCSLATLQGEFNISLLDHRQEYILEGFMHSDTKLCGRAFLKGVGLEENEDTWYIHAIRQFEMEIDLDEVICDDH